MNRNDPNVAMLELVAESLGEALREQLVFVGGAIAGVLITDPAMPEIRPTQDVDVVCSVVGRADDQRLGMQLRKQGFQEDERPEAPLCRWRIGEVALDVMPPSTFCPVAARSGWSRHLCFWPPSWKPSMVAVLVISS